MSDSIVPTDDSRTRCLRASRLGAVQVRGEKRALLAEQQEDWAAGRPSRPEDSLSRWPDDRGADSDAASLLVAEFFRRRERGERPSLGEYEENFPALGRAMAALVRSEDLIRSLGGKRKGVDGLLRLPEMGEELFGYRLRQPLGSGAFARVYLAEQPDLAGRSVVLKVSAIEGTEPQTLARLQHTNIVPIHSVHEDARAGLRAVCMPYFGGANLSSVLQHLWSATGRPTQGAQLIGSLEAVSSPAPGAPTREQGGGGPEAGHPAPEESAGPLVPLAHQRGLTYFEAVAWTVAQLADGLHHAHQRGVLHRDIKPSNILISAEGLPHLLDFNVSQDLAGDAAQAVLGGTVAYAAPEHLRALIDQTQESFQRVDRVSDLYSLGLVLVEMLTGQCPFAQAGSYSAIPTQLEAMAVERGKAAPSVREARSDVPWGLESITRTALDPDPARRYQQADHLAEDLRRFLEDRPLRYAPELSRVEQVRKFFRRHPRLTTSGSVALASAIVLLAVGSALIGVRGHLSEARTRLKEAGSRLRVAGAQERERAHDAGVVRALCLVNTTLGDRDHLRQGIGVCEETLALYDVPGGRPGGEHPDWASLAPGERRRLAEDRRELLLLLAGARVRLAQGDAPTLRGALELLVAAEAIRDLPPSKALWLDRASYWRQLGEAKRADDALARAETIPASNARDHYLLAISYARQGGTAGFKRAIAELDEALRLNPRHYWSAIQRGICHMELGESILAVGDFGTCTGLWPDHPWGYFNRGYMLDRSGKKAEAILDYTSALDRDPGLTAARVNRGLAHLEIKAYGPALADFDRALALGAGGVAVQAGRGIALEASGRHDESDAAFREAFRQAGTGPDPARIRLLWTHGFSVAARRPEEARGSFDEVLRVDPRHPQALYGLAMLAMEGGQLDLALGYFDRGLEADPGFTQARRSRAVIQARRGDWERASRDINWCLEREPTSGETVYAAACVAARAAAVSSGRRNVDQAIGLLQRAIALGSGLEARDDPDLAALADDPRFRRLVSGAASGDAGEKPGVASRGPHHL